MTSAASRATAGENDLCLHLSLTRFTNESRALKECRSVLSAGLFKRVLVTAVWDPGLPETEELPCGIEVWRVPLKTRWLPKWLPFQLIKYVEWLLRTWARLRASPPAVLHAHSVPSLPAAAVLKLLLGSRLIYDAHELESEASGIRNRARKMLVRLVERCLIPAADDMLVVGEMIADEYVRIYRISRPSVVLNCPPLAETGKQGLLREELGIPATSRILLYQGALAPGRGIERLLAVARDLQRDDLAFVFMGYGSLERAVGEASRAAAGRVFYKSAVSPDRVLDYTASADFGLVLIENISFSYYLSLPNKLFEYCMAGLPVLASDFPEIGTLVRKFNCGMTVDPGSTDSITRGIIALADSDYGEMSRHARELAVEYNWGREESKLIASYRKCLDRTPRT